MKHPSLQSHGDIGTSGSTVSNKLPFENKEIQVVKFPSAKQLLAHLSTAYIIAYYLHLFCFVYDYGFLAYFLLE